MFSSYYKLASEVHHHNLTDKEVPVETQELIMTSIDRCMERLQPLEVEVLKRRFGLDREPEKFKQIAKNLGYSAERIRLLHSKAIRKLRHPLVGFVMNHALGRAGLLEVSDTHDEQRFVLECLDKVQSGQALSDDELDKISINWLEVNPRSIHALTSNRINTLLDLKRQTKGDLMRYPNFGRKSLLEVEAAALRFGIALSF